ncbi:MAG: PVC-type heme-binding CxxCH protein, partial [Bacteroidota bacterium]
MKNQRYLLCTFVLVSIMLSQCTAPEVQPSAFEIHPAFQIELAAAEPLVIDPVDMEFDENGQAYVLEMPGYPLRDEESRIVQLTDQDNDGRFDQRKVFATDLRFATSLLPYDGGVLVAAPPDLLFLKDTDKDGVADQRETLMSGFADDNLQHNFNGLTYGIDNWIYAANGGNGGRPYFIGKEEKKISIRGVDFRFNLKTKVIEIVGASSGGFEIAMDNYGRLFETH